MSFDIFLQHVEVDPPRTEGIATKIVAAMKSFGASDPVVDAFGCRYLFNAPEICAEVSWDDADDRMTISPAVMTLDVSRLLHELMRVTGWVAIIPGEQLFVASLRDLPKDALQEGVPQITVVRSADDLHRLATANFAQWADYRDQVVKG